MTTLQDLLKQYGESHQNPINKRIHWVCVPLIFFSLLALLYSFSLHLVFFDVPITAAHVALFLILIYYIRLSSSLSIGMMVFGLLCLTLCNFLTLVGFRLWFVATIIFVTAWIGQFIGHHIEGKKPSFLKDVQFLLIGPAWLMSDLFNRWGIRI